MTGLRNRLTARTVASLSKAGRHADGGGLYLRIRPSGSKSWLFNYRVDRRRRDVGLGGVDSVTLGEARRLAELCREANREGKDPRSALRMTERTTFGDAAAQYIASREGDWRNDKTAYKWNRFIQRYGKTLTGMYCDQITRHDVEDALRPIWTRINHSARYMRSMIETILDYATVKGWREGDNPARWKGNLEHILTRKKPAVRHNRAIAFEDAPKLYARLIESRRSAAPLTAFILLTAARNGEARMMDVHEVDREARLWRVPANRMKRGIQHTVPLSRQAMAIVELHRHNKGLLFNGRAAGQPFSDATVRKIIRDLGFPDATAHGLRSTFRDWCGETGQPRELAELSLSHAIGNETERAYRRQTAIELRRPLMQAWADFLESGNLPKPQLTPR